jgi:hypothetical protein
MNDTSKKNRMRPLILVGLFLVGGVFVDQAVGRGFDRLLDRVKTGDKIGVTNSAIDHAGSDLIVFGSSRARHHIDPAVLEERLGCSAYNAGLDGQGIYYHRMVESMILGRGTSPKAFVLEIEPYGLHYTHADRAMQLTPYVDRDANVERLIDEITSYSWLKFLSRSYRYNGLALPILSNLLVSAAPVDPSFDGYEPLQGSLGPEDAFAARRPANRPAPEIRDDAVRLYEEFFRDARAHGIEMVLVLGPRMRRFANEGPLFDALVALAERESALLLHLDETRYPQFQDPALFRDYAHLNAEGARQFSELLADRLAAEFPAMCGGTDRFLRPGRN